MKRNRTAYRCVCAERPVVVSSLPIEVVSSYRSASDWAQALFASNQVLKLSPYTIMSGSSRMD